MADADSRARDEPRPHGRASLRSRARAVAAAAGPGEAALPRAGCRGSLGAPHALVRCARLVGRLGLLGLLALTPARGRADIYEYVDAEGVSHYTNVPQPSKTWRKVQFEGRRSREIKTPVEQRDRSPDRYSRYDEYLLEAARLYQLPVALLRAVMHIESDFDPNVVSVDGAQGLMQLMPFTADRMGVTNAFDPRQNILGGARFLRILANQWKGDLVLTVASYNAGAGAVERYHGVPPFGETRRYVNRVLERYNAYRAVASR